MDRKLEKKLKWGRDVDSVNDVGDLAGLELWSLFMSTKVAATVSCRQCFDKRCDPDPTFKIALTALTITCFRCYA